LAVSSGFCSAGRIGIVVTGFGLAPAVAGGAICACAEAAKTKAAIINVAESTDLMTNPGECRGGIRESALTFRQLSTSAESAPTAPRFKERLVVSPHPEERSFGRVSKDEGPSGAAWFETRVPRSSP
jgi:hypothetical protein